MKKLLAIYKKMIAYLYEKTNHSSYHTIVNVNFCKKDNQYKVQFTMAGMFFPATLYADAIVDQPDLLAAFSEADQLTLLFYSTRSIYKISAIDFMDCGRKMVSIQATLGHKSWTKRFDVNQITEEKNIMSKLPAQQRDVLLTMSTGNNVIPFEKIS